MLRIQWSKSFALWCGYGRKGLVGVPRLRLRHALDAADRLTPSSGVADDAAISHDESAAHQRVHRKPNDPHALERRDFAA